MKFTINGQIVDNSKSTKITIPKKKIISCNDYIYNKNNNRDILSNLHAQDYYTEEYLWNYFEIKIDLSKFPNETAYLIFSPYRSDRINTDIIPYLYTSGYELPNEFDINSIISDSTNVFDSLCKYFDYYLGPNVPTTVLEIINLDKDFKLTIHSPKFSGTINKSLIWSYSLPKIENQQNILTLGIGSKGNYEQEIGLTYDPYLYNPSLLSLKNTQFVFLNTEDTNLNHSFNIRDILTVNQFTDENSLETFSANSPNSHKYAYKFGLVNQSNNDIELNVASYKKDLTSMGEKLAKAVNGSLDGEALVEIKVDYDVKQILPTTKDKVPSNNFIYNGMNIKLSTNHKEEHNYSKNMYKALIECESPYYYYFDFIESRPTLLPFDFIVDFGIVIDNIAQVSFRPAYLQNKNPIGSCTVKDYQIFCSNNGIDYKLIKEDTYKSNDKELYSGLLEPAYTTFEPISARFLKLRIVSKYEDYTSDSYTYENQIRIANFRIYTNTKNLYIKEADKSVFNYKNNSFNQISTKSEWDKKSKEDKIILNKQDSFDNPQLSKIKNKLNIFRIIQNSDNIPLYEKQ